MNPRRLSLVFSAASLLLPASGLLAQAPPPAEKPAAESNTKEGEYLRGWGETKDPAGDCKFQQKDGKLTITVPGSATPHDLSTELKSSTAPRVGTDLSGDFDIQVKVEGEFEPGEQSTQAGRTGYTGAGLAVFADEKNYIRLERATLQHSGSAPRPYANFEIRVDGELERIGTTGDLPPIDISKPLWLRLTRSGDKMEGAISQDGTNWVTCEPKELTNPAWRSRRIKGGVAAISTSVKDFTPSFSGFQAVKGVAPEKTEGKEKEKEKAEAAPEEKTTPEKKP
jgi:regulation of enolase protein 1 (concanavalin A-like superfamily)